MALRQVVADCLGHEAAVREVSVEVAFDARDGNLIDPDVDLVQLCLLQLTLLVQHIELHADGPLHFSAPLCLLREVRREVVSRLAARIFRRVYGTRHRLVSRRLNGTSLTTQRMMHLQL